MGNIFSEVIKEIQQNKPSRKEVNFTQKKVGFTPKNAAALARGIIRKIKELLY